MPALADARSAVRRVLIAIGLWPVLRVPLHRVHDAFLLQLARAGLHDPAPFLPPVRDPLAPLRATEAKARAATTAVALLPHLIPLVANGSALAESCLARMRQFRLQRDVAQHVDRLDARLAAIRALPELQDVLTDPARLAAFYQREGYQLFSSPSSQKLVVVFTTILNNFGVSNAVLYALLRRHDASILLLKDPTVCAYGCGVRGLGHDPEQLAHSVAELAAKMGSTEIYIMGYSSGGYPSLLFSSLIPCDGYLGFSIHTGSGRHGDPLPRRRVFSDAQDHWVTSHVAPRFQSNLRGVFENRHDGCSRILVVGAQDEIDMAHAQDMANCPGFEVVTLENCAHDSVSTVLERGMMDRLLQRLLKL